MGRTLDLAVDSGTSHSEPLQGKMGLKAKLTPKKA
jgi:hypothetical protein